MRILAILLLSATALFAQDESVKIRPGESANAKGGVLGAIPDNVVDVKKAKGSIGEIDLVARTVSIQPKKGAVLVLAFAQPNGREQIKTSKKFEKASGRKRLRLEELNEGSKVQLRYYPALSQLMELTIESN
jgi:hypothetical protein